MLGFVPFPPGGKVLGAGFSESEPLSAGAAAGLGAGERQPGRTGVQSEEPGPLEAGCAAGSLAGPAGQGREGERRGREAPPTGSGEVGGAWLPGQRRCPGGLVAHGKTNTLKGSDRWGVFVGSGRASRETVKSQK